MNTNNKVKGNKKNLSQHQWTVDDLKNSKLSYMLIPVSKCNLRAAIGFFVLCTAFVTIKKSQKMAMVN